MGLFKGISYKNIVNENHRKTPSKYKNKFNRMTVGIFDPRT
jgi:hypothetical protein